MEFHLHTHGVSRKALQKFFFSFDMKICVFNLFVQAGILMGEVTGVWPGIRKQIDDPFLVSDSLSVVN